MVDKGWGVVEIEVHAMRELVRLRPAFGEFFKSITVLRLEEV